MFRALLCPSSGARDYNVDYHIGHVVLGLLSVGGEMQFGWSSVRVAGSNRLNMFQTLLCPSSGTREYDVVYHTSRVVLGLLFVGVEVQFGSSSVRVAGFKNDTPMW